MLSSCPGTRTRESCCGSLRGDYPRVAISFVRENINTREASTLDLALEAPDFCISRRIRAKVFRTSVDALGT
jgi:hypothetical protein